MARRGKRRCGQLPGLHPDAARIDIGASELFVAIPAGRDTHPVRSFATFTQDLNALADWLQRYEVRSVAMGSTSVYWIPVYQTLESRGFEVYLVNAHHAKNVPGRKSGVSDCRCIQYLHSVLLRGSVRPPAAICAIRSFWRHRVSLIPIAAEHVLPMQKALDQMNLQVHRVVNDIPGVSGLKIIDAILTGERDSFTVARLCPGGVKNGEHTIAKSLEGDYRPEHFFALRQSLAAFRYYQQLISEVDRELANHLGELGTAATAEVEPPHRTKHSHCQQRRCEPKFFDLRAELYRIFGVDLTNVPGISAITAQTILCEIGTDVSQFRNASAFASWLGLCPEEKISGGKVLVTKSRHVRSRVATASRMGAHSQHHAKDYLGEFFRRITRKLGKPQAVTAIGHKLARIIFHLLSTKELHQPCSTNVKRRFCSERSCGYANRQPNPEFLSSRPRTREESLAVPFTTVYRFLNPSRQERSRWRGGRLSVVAFGAKGAGASKLASVTEKGVSVTKRIQRMREELVRRNYAESTMRIYLQVVEDLRR